MSLRDSYTFEEPTDKQWILLDEGQYPFVVTEVFEWEVSKKAGNDVLPIMLTVGEGRDTVQVKDYLTFVDSAKWRIDSLVKCILADKIEVGKKVNFNDPSWMVGRGGIVELGIIEKPSTKKAGEMVKFNEVKAYIYEKSKIEGREYTPSGGNARPAPAPAPPAAAVMDDDDIPF